MSKLLTKVMIDITVQNYSIIPINQKLSRSFSNTIENKIWMSFYDELKIYVKNILHKPILEKIK